MNTQWAYDAHKEDPLTFDSAFDVRNSIFSAMYAPRSWSDYANGDLIDLWSSFSSPDLLEDRRRKRDLSTGEGVIHPTIRKRQFDDKPSNALEAISCGDSPDLTDLTTTQVFDEILRVTRDVSGFCTILPPHSNILGLHPFHSWATYASTLPLLPPMAHTCRRTFLWSFQRNAIQSDSCHRKQSRPNNAFQERQSSGRPIR